MSDEILRSVQAGQLKTDVPKVSVGDTVNVHVRIIEGAKERIQVFSGVVLKLKGSGLEQTMLVRRIVANEGVERTFPLHSPRVSLIEVVRHGHTRRSRLYFLRDRVGKARRLPDRRRGLKNVAGVIPAPAGKKSKAAAAAAAKAAEGDSDDS